VSNKFTRLRAFTALDARNFRLYFFGQCCALTGTWMQRLAMVWLVMILTGSGAKMGLVEFFNQSPAFIVGIFIGIYLDRYDLRRVLIGTQLVMILQSLALASLVYLELVTYPAILTLSMLLGIITAIDMPARQASMSQMIDHPSQLQSALSLSSSSFNLARLIGPAVAGFIINASGELACFLLNAAAHLAVLYAFIIMRLPERKLARRDQRAFDSLRDGVSYAWSVKPIRLCALFNYMFCFMAMAHPVLIPLFTKEVLGGDARHVGFMLGGFGLGALIGALYIAARMEIRNLPGHIWRMQLLFGTVFLAFCFAAEWYIALLLTPFIGFALVSSLISNNALIQSLVDDDKRGRVLSFYSLGLLGFGPAGAMLIGKLADHFDVQMACLFCATACLIIGIVHSRRQKDYDAAVPAILATKGL